MALLPLFAHIPKFPILAIVALHGNHSITTSSHALHSGLDPIAKVILQQYF